jgi:hypothetical protein
LRASARGSGDLAGFHQLLEAPEVPARLDRRFALEHLGDELADRAGWRIVRIVTTRPISDSFWPAISVSSAAQPFDAVNKASLAT